MPSTPRRRSEAELPRGPALGRLFELEGYLPDADTNETLEPIGIDELEHLLADGKVEVLDVREKSERDEGYIDGTRHMPYRLVRAFADDLRAEQKPVVTICTTGSRATIAASVLTAAGVDARPVLGEGVEDWAERGGQTVHFRRCGN